MKRILTVSVTLAVSAALLFVAPTFKHNAFALHAGSGCTNANLSGHYGFAFSGFQVQHSGSVPFNGAGSAVADGESPTGHLAATFADSVNGSSSGGINETYTATYTVNSDCTGLLTATPGSGGDNFAFVIVNGGAEILATDLSAGDTLNLDFKKQ